MRFADYLQLYPPVSRTPRATPKEKKDYLAAFAKRLRNAPKFVIDPVAEYYYSPQRLRQGRGQFPKCIPPFMDQWIEAKHPTKTSWLGPHRWGALIWRVPPDHELLNELHNSLAPKKLLDTWRSPEVKYFVFMEPVIELEDASLILGTIIHAIDGHGNILENEHGVQWSMGAVSQDELALQGEMLSEVISQVMDPILFSISLMNCKNVHVVQQPTSPDELRHAKAAFKRKKLAGVTPFNSYHVLTINPLSTQVVEPGGTGVIMQREHLVRGHFVDYRAGAGLFGKYHGVFWRDQHLRGNPQLGQITTDFNVNAPDIHPADLPGEFE